MRKQYSPFVIIFVLVLSCTKKDHAPLHSQQTKENIDSTEMIGLASSIYRNVKYTLMTGRSIGTNNANWVYHIKNYSNYKVTAVVEQIKIFDGTILYRIKKTLKLKPRQKKYVGEGYYTVYSRTQITWSILKDKKGW